MGKFFINGKIRLIIDVLMGWKQSFDFQCAPYKDSDQGIDNSCTKQALEASPLLVHHGITLQLVGGFKSVLLFLSENGVRVQNNLMRIGNTSQWLMFMLWGYANPGLMTSCWGFGKKTMGSFIHERQLSRPGCHGFDPQSYFPSSMYGMDQFW